MILTVILLPLRPASLMNKNPQRSIKINHGMHPVRRKDRSINLNMYINFFVVIFPLCNNSCGSFFAVV